MMCFLKKLLAALLLCCTLLSVSAHASVTLRNAVATNFSGSSGNATKPAGTAQNDLLIALVVIDGNAATLTITTGGTSDWTLIGTKQSITNGDTQDAALYYKIAGASEPATYTITNSNGSDSSILIIAYTGADTSTPIAASSVVNTNASAAVASPVTATGSSITTTAANQTVLYAATLDWNSGTAMTWGSLGSLTSRVQATPAQFSNGIIADLVQVSAGATGALSATGTLAGQQARYIAYQVAIKDAAAGSPATLSSPTPSGTLGTSTTATVGATSDQNSGTFYAVLSTSNNVSTATATQIKAGQNSTGAAASFAANASISTTSPSVGFSGLSASTTYFYAAVQNNANGDSNVVSGSFTTAAASSTVVNPITARGGGAASPITLY